MEDGQGGQWNKLGAYGGSAIGAFGWLIGLFIVCLIQGQMGFFWSVFPLSFLLTASLALLLLLHMELLIRVAGRGSGLFQLILWGDLTLFMGLLLLFFHLYITPMIEAHQGMARAMHRMGSSFDTGPFHPVLLLLVSTVLLGIGFWRVMKLGGEVGT